MQIDLVYLWVDDTDYDWKRKFLKYSGNFEKYDEDAVSPCRYFNNDELLFSLRSVEKYAPWINQIFIVTDNQTPNWLNTDNKKVKIIDHRDIIPKKYLPLFNSTAIENRIPYIQDLSEHFLYANDDMFFWDYVNEDFFFSNDKMICRMGEKIANRKYVHVYGYIVNQAMHKMRERFKFAMPYFMHHGIDSYKKSVILECIEEFNEEFEKTLNSRFREYSDIHRSIFSYYALYKNEGIFKQVKQSLYNKYILKESEDSHCYNITSKILHKIKDRNTKLMCLNDCRKTTNYDRKILREILLEKFPEKSSFEK